MNFERVYNRSAGNGMRSARKTAKGEKSESQFCRPFWAIKLPRSFIALRARWLQYALHPAEEIRLGLDAGERVGADRVAVLARDLLVARDAGGEEAREDPSHEVVGIDLGHAAMLLLAKVVCKLRVEEFPAIKERLGILLRALPQIALIFRGSLYIKDERGVGEDAGNLGIVELAEGARRVVHEVAVPVDLVRLADELGDILHRGDFRIVVQDLPALEFGKIETAPSRIAELSEKPQHRLQVVDGDVARDVNGVRAKQVAEKRNLHRLALDLIEDRLA